MEIDVGALRAEVRRRTAEMERAATSLAREVGLPQDLTFALLSAMYRHGNGPRGEQPGPPSTEHGATQG